MMSTTLSCRDLAQSGWGKFQPIKIPMQTQNRVDHIFRSAALRLREWDRDYDLSRPGLACLESYALRVTFRDIDRLVSTRGKCAWARLRGREYRARGGKHLHGRRLARVRRGLAHPRKFAYIESQARYPPAFRGLAPCIGLALTR